MIYNLGSSMNVLVAHTIQEFISMDKYTGKSTGYRDLSFYETIDNLEYVVKNVVDDYLYELKEMAVEVGVESRERDKFQFNPKLLCYHVYGNTKLYYIILKINDMCNVHEFTLEKNKLLMLRNSDMQASISSIYKVENAALQKYNNAHKNDKSIVIIDKYKGK